MTAIEDLRKAHQEESDFWEAYSGSKRKPWKKLDLIRKRIRKIEERLKNES